MPESLQYKKFKLHEAIEIVLKEMPNKQGTYTEVAQVINDRGLYKRKDGQEVPAFQIKLRATLSKGKYAEKFESIGKYGMRLKD